MKMSVLYHSDTGNTKKMAEVIVAGMQEVKGVEARAFSIDAVDETWVKESVCVVAGSPTYYASTTGKMKLFLETLGEYDVSGKLGGAFATENYLHGGAETAIQIILTHMMVYGMVVYSGGGACGDPVIHLGPVALGDHLSDTEVNFRLYGERMARKAAELFG